MANTVKKSEGKGLKKKLGPLSYGGWLAVGGGAGIIYYLYSRYKSNQAAAQNAIAPSSTSAPITGSGSGGGYGGYSLQNPPPSLAAWQQAALMAGVPFNDISAFMNGSCVSQQGYTALNAVFQTVGLPPGITNFGTMSICPTNTTNNQKGLITSGPFQGQTFAQAITSQQTAATNGGPPAPTNQQLTNFFNAVSNGSLPSTGFTTQQSTFLNNLGTAQQNGTAPSSSQLQNFFNAINSGQIPASGLTQQQINYLSGPIGSNPQLNAAGVGATYTPSTTTPLNPIVAYHNPANNINTNGPSAPIGYNPSTNTTTVNPSEYGGGNGGTLNTVPYSPGSSVPGKEYNLPFREVNTSANTVTVPFPIGGNLTPMNTNPTPPPPPTQTPIAAPKTWGFSGGKLTSW